ncbi:MAG: enoyl-CoA hydratase-related protein [Candidatus Sericytochromatia bacterium]
MTPETPFVQLELRERVALITLNHPPVNALSPAVIEQLDTVLTSVTQNSEIGAVVLTGHGPKVFVAGADIKAMSGMSAAEAEDLARNGQATLNKLADMPKLTICAINGLALGGGLELAMACDLRLAAEHAKMGQPEINLGIIPGFGGTQRLPRLIGSGHALEMLITGDPIDAATAQAWGLVNAVYPADQLLDKALELAHKAANKAPVAVKLIVEAVHAGLQESLSAGLKREVESFQRVFETEDKSEGIQAFLEKRPPQFKGF